MTITIDRQTDMYSRPNARFDGDGTLEIRASAVGNCRRALWYEATGHQVTNPRSDDSLTMLEAGNALEPVVLRAMQRSGWDITPTDRDNPRMVSLRLGPTLAVSGHVDAAGVAPIFGNEPSIVEVKTRGPEAYKKWRTLGAERSHPESVWQAAFYTYAAFDQARDVVIATLDTGNRVWDYEVIPAHRVERAFEHACARLGELAAHHLVNGPDPAVLPERDFTPDDWQCKRCPFLNACLPGSAVVSDEVEDEPAEEAEPVSDEEAQAALREYEQAQEMLKVIEEDKQWALGMLRTWLSQQGKDKAKLEGREKTRTVGMVKNTRYNVDHKKLNALLDPETRAGIVTENVSHYLRIS
ncbi:MAG: hypothetical protein OXU26_09990 [Acidobacteriota bacterium]|nr:hypothetical protein [Acidobacteriota bacterium]